MKSFFPGPGGVDAWHKILLGRNPFACDSRAAAASFFRPASRLCGRPVPAEKGLPASIPPSLRKKIGMALRFWQVSQEITGDLVLSGKPLPGMDMPVTLNFAMALGNYSRFLLFSAETGIPVEAALFLHAAFIKEMTEMPAAMAGLSALKRRKLSARKAFFSGRNSPAASAFRLAAACAQAFKKRNS